MFLAKCNPTEIIHFLPILIEVQLLFSVFIMDKVVSGSLQRTIQTVADLECNVACLVHIFAL